MAITATLSVSKQQDFQYFYIKILQIIRIDFFFFKKNVKKVISVLRNKCDVIRENTLF